MSFDDDTTAPAFISRFVATDLEHGHLLVSALARAFEVPFLIILFFLYPFSSLLHHQYKKQLVLFACLEEEYGCQCGQAACMGPRAGGRASEKLVQHPAPTAST